jgi:PEP-CTERM motif
MHKSLNIFAAVTVTALALSLAVDPAKAAVINWGSPVTIAGASDVITTGTLHASANFGGSDETVNGVLFKAFSVSGTSTTVGDITLASPALNQYTYVPPATITSPYVDLPLAYRNILSPFAYTDGASQQFTVSGLTLGDYYAIQFWVEDPRGAFGTRTVTVGTQTLDVNTTDVDGGLGQWVQGRFVADATTQSFSVGPGSGGLTYANAMQVRAVPEPSTYAMALAGLACVGYSMLRRRRAR